MCHSVCVEVTHTHTREGLDRTALGREISGQDRSYGRSLYQLIPSSQGSLRIEDYHRHEPPGLRQLSTASQDQSPSLNDWLWFLPFNVLCKYLCSILKKGREVYCVNT